MKSYEQNRESIAAEIAKFPVVFGLRGFPGHVFTIFAHNCYVSEENVVLYTSILGKEGENFTESWTSFAKGSPEELQKEVVPTLLVYSAMELHRRSPGLWIETDSEMTKILRTAGPKDTPSGGAHWWRTHHLVRQLGGTC